MAKKQPHKTDGSMKVLDAVAEIVHQGYGRLLDAVQIRLTLVDWKPNCCANYEYLFAWNPDLDIDSLPINWKRPNQKILQRVVKRPARMKKILSGSPMTKKEQQAYRLEIARQKHGYLSAAECLQSGSDCKWVDLSFVTDSKGRAVYILEMGDADTTTDEDLDSMPAEEFIEWHEGVWDWKARGLEFFGPFASEEQAEEWMAENGAFDDE